MLMKRLLLALLFVAATLALTGCEPLGAIDGHVVGKETLRATETIELQDTPVDYYYLRVQQYGERSTVLIRVSVPVYERYSLGERIKGPPFLAARPRLQ